MVVVLWGCCSRSFGFVRSEVVVVVGSLLLLLLLLLL